MSLYLIRTQENKILGPYEASEVTHRISAGEFDPNDEVCRSNHYWIYLHEREELQKLLGVEAPLKKRKSSDDEDTETQTESITKTEVEKSDAAKQSITDKKNYHVPGAVEAPKISPNHHHPIENPSAAKAAVIALVALLLWVLFRVFKVSQL